MAKECGFFNAHMVGEEYDRVYLAEQFAAYFASFIGNGVFGKSMQKLQVVGQSNPDMSVKVLSGEAWINGWWYRDKDSYTLQIQTADGMLPRKDIVVLRWGSYERDMWIEVITGVPASRPVKPSIRRDADYYDLQLAVINIPAGAINITQTNIQDTRLDTIVCGLVTGTVEQIDTTGLYNQFESYFQDFKDKNVVEWYQWFEQFRTFVESLENGELLMRIEEIFSDIFSIATNDDIDAIIAGTYLEKPERDSLLDIATNADIDAIIAGTYVEVEEGPTDSDEITIAEITEIVNNAFMKGDDDLWQN